MVSSSQLQGYTIALPLILGILDFHEQLLKWKFFFMNFQNYFLVGNLERSAWLQFTKLVSLESLVFTN